MHIDLSGKTALITGSTTGMGFAIALGLARSGATVTIHGSSEAHVTDALDALRKEAPTAKGIAADLTGPLDHVFVRLPAVDILVTGNGPTEPKPFFDLTDSDWERYFRIYVLSSVRLARHYAKGMVDRGWGRLVFNAHLLNGHMPGELTQWGAAKAALLALSRGIAENLAGTPVTSNAIIPGPAHTQESFTRRVPLPPGSTFEQVERDLFAGPLSDSLIRRFIDPAEVANAVVFLCSQQASAITGAALRVDGGAIRTLP